MEKRSRNKGVKFEASFGQALSAVLLIALMLVLPIGGYEYATYNSTKNARSAYTVDSLREDGRLEGEKEDEGRVAGITTGSDQIDSLVNDPAVLMAVGGVITTLSLFLIVYMLLPKKRVSHGYS